jgi:hypothetical protein
MTRSSGRRPARFELVTSVVVIGVLATIPLWAEGWWTALPFAAALAGVVGGRWLRWFWALPVGFAAGALVWAIELALIPVDPRTRLTNVLAPAEGLSPAVFLAIGPILFGLIAAVAGWAVAGALRLIPILRAAGPELGRSGPTGPETSP